MVQAQGKNSGRLQGQVSDVTACDNNEANAGVASQNTFQDPAQLAGSNGGMDVKPLQTTQQSSDSYEERKIALAREGQLVPAFKHSSLKGVPINRVDRKGN